MRHVEETQDTHSKTRILRGVPRVQVVAASLSFTFGALVSALPSAVVLCLLPAVRLAGAADAAGMGRAMVLWVKGPAV